MSVACASKGLGLGIGLDLTLTLTSGWAGLNLPTRWYADYIWQLILGMLPNPTIWTLGPVFRIYVSALLWMAAV